MWTPALLSPEARHDADESGAGRAPAHRYGRATRRTSPRKLGGAPVHRDWLTDEAGCCKRVRLGARILLLRLIRGIRGAARHDEDEGPRRCPTAAGLVGGTR